MNKDLWVMVDICLIPLGVGVSLSEYIAACQKVFQDAGLAHQMHAYGTNVEGEWEAVMAAVKRCHEEVHKMGAPRVTTSIRLGTRTDRSQSMQDKVDSVNRRLEAND